VASTLEAIKTIGAYHRSLFDIPVVGITGSVGKTSAKELIAAVLGARYKTLRTPGNLNNELGVPLTLLSLDETYEAAVIEMGISDFGEMSRLAQMVRPQIFVMTKIGYSHLDNLVDLDGVLKAKTEAFRYMNADGVAVLNGDDDYLRTYVPKGLGLSNEGLELAESKMPELLPKTPAMRKVMFGLGEHNDVRIENVSSQGVDAIICEAVIEAKVDKPFRLSENQLGKHPGKQTEPSLRRFEVRVPAYGTHITELMGAAVTVGMLLGLNDKDIANGFASYESVEGRAKVSNTGKITLIDDCYNANPNSVKAALSSLSLLPNRRVAILGDMLNLETFSDEMHFDVGVFAAQKGIDCLICCGERAKLIYNGFLSVGDTSLAMKEKAHYFSKKSDLISNLPALIKKDDAVLVKASNGMKFNEIVRELS
jgi:UDP-N-acetylmuramoyl-tripeptide--D-alanyl-D-alanine ligase